MSSPVSQIAKDATDATHRRPVRILHLETAPGRRDILRAALADAGIACEFLGPSTPSDPASAPPAQDADLVLLGHSADASEMAASFARMRDIAPRLPCLVIPEDASGLARAVDALRAAINPLPPRELSAPACDLDALRRFADGVAHEFNNALTVINGYASLLVTRDNLPEDIRSSLQQIYSAGERAAAFSRRLLVFSRSGAASPRRLDLNAGVREAANTLSGLIGKKIALDLALGADLPPVAAEPGFIDNVLTNLAVHARELMRDGGKLTVRTQLRELDAAEPAASHASAPKRRPGRFACLSVSDTGPGIPAESLARVFEPFALARKKSSEGVGLSLALVASLTANHGGWVEAENNPGGGAVFHVFLPAADDAPAATLASDVRAPSPPPPAAGGETILFVEDEAPVREFARAVLQQHGYRVLLATSGADALETWKWHSERIRLLVTDLVLPDDFDGLELARRIRSERPALPVLCTSGHPQEAMERLAAASRGIRFLPKPYPTRLLTQTVRECLDAR